MEAILTLLQSLQLNFLQAFILGLFVFAGGYLVARQKIKKVNTEKYELQQEVLNLNAELLYGKQEATVIGLSKNNRLTSVMANNA